MRWMWCSWGRYGHSGLFKRPSKQDKIVARQALASVGMQDFAERSIGQLSGGQQQRVFLARALAQNADIYFLDEPFAGVDAATEKTIIDILKDLKAQGKKYFLLCITTFKPSKNTLTIRFY